MCVCHLPEPLQDAFRRHTCMIVPLVQPPGQGMWALGLRCMPLDLCIPGGSRAQTAETLPSAVAGRVLCHCLFTPLPWLCGLVVP